MCMLFASPTAFYLCTSESFICWHALMNTLYYEAQTVNAVELSVKHIRPLTVVVIPPKGFQRVATATALRGHWPGCSCWPWAPARWPWWSAWGSPTPAFPAGSRAAWRAPAGSPGPPGGSPRNLGGETGRGRRGGGGSKTEAGWGGQAAWIKSTLWVYYNHSGRW